MVNDNPRLNYSTELHTSQLLVPYVHCTMSKSGFPAITPSKELAVFTTEIKLKSQQDRKRKHRLGPWYLVMPVISVSPRTAGPLMSLCRPCHQTRLVSQASHSTTSTGNSPSFRPGLVLTGDIARITLSDKAENWSSKVGKLDSFFQAKGSALQETHSVSRDNPNANVAECRRGTQEPGTEGQVQLSPVRCAGIAVFCTYLHAASRSGSR